MGVDRSVEPHGVVDRRDLQILPLVAMRTGGRGDHAEVGQIRQRTGLHERIVGHGLGDSNPRHPFVLPTVEVQRAVGRQCSHLDECAIGKVVIGR